MAIKAFPLSVLAIFLCRFLFHKLFIYLLSFLSFLLIIRKTTLKIIAIIAMKPSIVKKPYGEGKLCKYSRYWLLLLTSIGIPFEQFVNIIGVYLSQPFYLTCSSVFREFSPCNSGTDFPSSSLKFFSISSTDSIFNSLFGSFINFSIIFLPS